MIGRMIETRVYSKFWRANGALSYWAITDHSVGLEDFLEQEFGDLADSGEIMDFRIDDTPCYYDGETAYGCTVVSWIDKDSQLGQYCFKWQDED